MRRFSYLSRSFVFLAGTAPPANRALDGVSFANRLRGKEASRRSFTYCEEAVLPKPGGVEPDGTSSGLKWVRNQEWKLYNDGRLFYMSKDPLEKSPFLVNQGGDDAARMRKGLLQAFRKLELRP